MIEILCIAYGLIGIILFTILAYTSCKAKRANLADMLLVVASSILWPAYVGILFWFFFQVK